MTDTKKPSQSHRLLSDDETKIWEAADRGTNDADPAWRALREKLAAELAAITCMTCGKRCDRLRWRTLGEEVRWISRCCHAPLPADERQ